MQQQCRKRGHDNQYSIGGLYCDTTTAYERSARQAVQHWRSSLQCNNSIEREGRSASTALGVHTVTQPVHGDQKAREYLHAEDCSMQLLHLL